MGWELGLIEAAEDSVITPTEVTGLMTDTLNSAVQGMVMVGIMGMVVKGFYGMLGPKKFAKQKEEVLEMVKEIW